MLFTHPLAPLQALPSACVSSIPLPSHLSLVLTCSPYARSLILFQIYSQRRRRFLVQLRVFGSLLHSFGNPHSFNETKLKLNYLITRIIYSERSRIGGTSTEGKEGYTYISIYTLHRIGHRLHGSGLASRVILKTKTVAIASPFVYNILW